VAYAVPSGDGEATLCQVTSANAASGSIDDGQVRFQREGYADAITHPAGSANSWDGMPILRRGPGHSPPTS
jgi:hypothetical protein